VRVALFSSSFAPDVGGVEELTARLSVQLQRSGGDVEVWTIRHSTMLRDVEYVDGVRVRRFMLPLPRLAVGALAGFPLEATRAWAAIRAAATEFDPHIIHVQCFSANGAYATWLSKRVGAPLVISLQGETFMDDDDIFDRSHTLRMSLRYGLRSAAAVTGCSRFVLDDAERRFGLAPRRGTVVPNGVELAEAVTPLPLVLPFDRFVFGLGRVVTKKGFDLLLAAFVRIARRHPNVGLVIGGDGSARTKLVQAAAAAGVSRRVVLPGTLSRAQIAWAMGTADVFVLPSRIEPFGIVVLEALRSGCPTIVSSHGGAGEIVRSGLDGLIVDPLDADVLAGAIDKVISDENLASRLRIAGRSRAAHFEWGAIADRYREVYERVSGRTAN